MKKSIHDALDLYYKALQIRSEVQTPEQQAQVADNLKIMDKALNIELDLIADDALMQEKK